MHAFFAEKYLTEVYELTKYVLDDLYPNICPSLNS